MKRITFAPSAVLELESLADWLVTSPELRQDVVAIHSGAIARGKPAFGDSKAGRNTDGRFERRHYSGQWQEWNRRVRKLAKINKLTERQQVEQVIRRAMALAEIARRS